ncbi:MAG: hypothetical protein Q9228_004105 [Teloschistes exilis]
MESDKDRKDDAPVKAAEQQNKTATAETVKATRPDAGLRDLDHYKNKLPSWRYAARQKLIPLVRWETPYVAKLQNTMRSPLLDSYFSITANLGTHTFFMIFLPVLFWCGYTNLGRGMVHVLASGVFLSGFIKDMLCLPRPLSPPLTRISMSHSVSLEYGFPSTHSTNAVSVAVYAVYMLRSAGSSINPTVKLAMEISSYFYATSIILGRLYCGMHGFFDVLVGGTLGAALAMVECLYGEAMADLVFLGSPMAPTIILFAILALVRIHPEPADDCPCFDDSVAFAGVIIGVELGNWHFAQSALAWDLPMPATVPFDLQVLGWPKAVARVIVGVVVVFAWREIMKPTLLKFLPPLFRIIESLGLSLPRKFFVQASMYTKVPRNLKTDNVLPAISEIPSIITSVRHLRRNRSESVGPQSEADVYEALAVQDRERKASNPLMSRIRQIKKDQISDSNKSWSDRASSNSWMGSSGPVGLPTPAGSQADLYNSSLMTDVFVDAPLTPNSLSSAVATPTRRLSEDRRQLEKDEKEMFSQVEKPRVRYDVEVITKLIVYAEPTEVTQKTSQDSSQSAQSPSQHGIHEPHVPARSSLRNEDGAAEQRPPLWKSETPPNALSEDGEDGTGQDSYELQRRVSSTSSKRTGSPVDRIIEHEEAALTAAKRRNDGPAFTVVQSKGSQSQRLNLTDFPNEVLTHILSHLPPSTLSEVSFVSRRFRDLVTSPHAWRIAFSRHFPAQEALTAFDQGSAQQEVDTDKLRSERRVFTRLTALASWRREYILRTQLLRSLVRGKPATLQEALGSGSPRAGSSNVGNAQITYNSNLVTTVNHLDATFGTSLTKRLPNFIHGADEVGSACLSDPRAGKVDHWGFADPQMFTQFLDDMPGVPQHGLGPGEVVGVPNTMDVSRQNGMVYAEGIPGGKVYYRSTEERRGRLLAGSIQGSWPELGIPHLTTGPIDTQTPCCVWTAKTHNVLDRSDGLIGILSGSSHGVVTAYSVGTTGLDERRIERGEITCRWILSPGVPIIAFSVDENITARRLASGRIWAVALNALGELYYLTNMPTRPYIERKANLTKVHLEQLAWETGRTVHWALCEPSRRVARPDPFESSDIDGSYSPRSSWNDMGLSSDQIAAETKEIQTFLSKKPKHFQKVNDDWDMRRRLEVDFAGDDESAAGENIIVVQCGLDEGQLANIKRYTRCKVPNPGVGAETYDASLPGVTQKQDAKPSLFGAGERALSQEPSWSFEPVRRGSAAASSEHPESAATIEEWRISTFLLGGLKTPQITTTSIDMSTYALLAIFEDPLLSIGGSSVISSPTSSPLPQGPRPSSPSDIPGQRARFFAAGTKNGTIIIWNMRDPISSNSAIEITVKPVRIIYTDSPQISCLALSALYLVHGGNDGLVQAWDPLASTTDPIRTLNSRFSSRARRRLVQAEASPQGVGINLFAAGAIFLDPNPTVLRGMVSLGTHLRYWSYSSSAADQYKSSKRRLRRSERGSNQGADCFTGTGRGALKDYIANEKAELEQEKKRKRKEDERLRGRFGLDLLGPGATEDEILAYATLLSEESARSDEARRRSGSEASSEHSTVIEGVSSSSLTTAAAAVAPVEAAEEEESIDPDIAKAIRLSLQESSPHAAAAAEASFPIRVRKAKRASSSPLRGQGGSPSVMKKIVASSEEEQDDLDFALRLSLVEEESRHGGGKGKGKERAREE